MNHESIKPCPFCGETPDEHDEDTFGERTEGTRHIGFIVCGCGCWGPDVPIAENFGRNPNSWRPWAVEVWNTRITEAA